ncbi:MAG: hypothetical protein HQL13_00165, partial [Candidatus Omnitrophica bacterium]|nr:hypothetical protein [Candidatus Omnitrophota bacterium]
NSELEPGYNCGQDLGEERTQAVLDMMGQDPFFTDLFGEQWFQGAQEILASRTQNFLKFGSGSASGEMYEQWIKILHWLYYTNPGIRIQIAPFLFLTTFMDKRSEYLCQLAKFLTDQELGALDISIQNIVHLIRKNPESFRELNVIGGLFYSLISTEIMTLPLKIARSAPQQIS